MWQKSQFDKWRSWEIDVPERNVVTKFALDPHLRTQEERNWETKKNKKQFTHPTHSPLNIPSQYTHTIDDSHSHTHSLSHTYYLKHTLSHTHTMIHPNTHTLRSNTYSHPHDDTPTLHTHTFLSNTHTSRNTHTQHPFIRLKKRYATNVTSPQAIWEDRHGPTVVVVSNVFLQISSTFVSFKYFGILSCNNINYNVNKSVSCLQLFEFNKILRE